MIYDAIIIGCGPAGAMAARVLALAGKSAIVLEQMPSAHGIVRSTGGSWADELIEMGIPETAIHRIKNGKIVSTKYEACKKTEGVCNIDMRELQEHLAGQARKSGAEILFNATATEYAKKGDDGANKITYLKDGRKHEIKARLVIDASGPSGFLARKHFGKIWKRVATGIEIETIPEKNNHQDEFIFILSRKLAPGGYCWVMPCKGRMKIGYTSIRPDFSVNVNETLEALLQTEFFKKYGKLKIIEKHGGIFPAEKPLEKLHGNDFLICGDAGSLGSQMVGEGVRFAMISGKMAGEYGIEFLDGKKDALKRYENEWRKKYAHDFSMGLLFQKAVCKMNDSELDSLVQMLDSIDYKILRRMFRTEFDLEVKKELIKKGIGRIGLVWAVIRGIT